MQVNDQKTTTPTRCRFQEEKEKLRQMTINISKEGQVDRRRDIFMSLTFANLILKTIVLFNKCLKLITK